MAFSIFFGYIHIVDLNAFNPNAHHISSVRPYGHNE